MIRAVPGATATTEVPLTDTAPGLLLDSVMLPALPALTAGFMSTFMPTPRVRMPFWKLTEVGAALTVILQAAFFLLKVRTTIFAVPGATAVKRPSASTFTTVGFELVQVKAEALPLVRETTDEIMAQYNAGIDFKALINRYSTDRTDRNVNGDGYPFHPESKLWPANFIQAASALEKAGDISQPFVTEQGVHILMYAGEVPAGEHVLTDDERKLLNAAALRYYQMEKLNELIDGWQADYEIETHPELLKY